MIFKNLSIWSPNENQIVFDSDRDGVWNVYSIDEDGTGLEKITNNGGYNASCSSDGSKIVFISERNGNRDLYIKNISNGQINQITDSSFYKEDPKWSPF